jgi:hypothetical protein
VHGQSVTFTVTVKAAAPGNARRSGSVTFYNGAPTLGTGTLNGSGSATFTTKALAVGSRAVTVVYGGNANFTTSDSAVLNQVVDFSSGARAASIAKRERRDEPRRALACCLAPRRNNRRPPGADDLVEGPRTAHGPIPGMRRVYPDGPLKSDMSVRVWIRPVSPTGKGPYKG